MNLLYLAHRIPYPPNKGDKIRSFNEIKYLSQSHEIDLVCLADDPNDLKHKTDLEKYCNHVFVQPLNRTAAKLKGMLSLIAGKSISVGYFWHKKVQATVNHWLSEKEYEAIICFSSPMAEYVFRAGCIRPEKAQGTRHKAQGKQEKNTDCPAPPPNGLPASGPPSLPTSSHQPTGKRQEKPDYLEPCAMRPEPNENCPPPNLNSLSSSHPPSFQASRPMLVMDYCDLDSDKWRQYSEQTKFPLNVIYKLESKRLLQYEKKVNNSFDHSIFVSQNEADLFLKLYPAAKTITVIPNGVDTDYFSPEAIKPAPCALRLSPSSSSSTLGLELSTMNPTPCAMSPAPILLFTGAMDYHANIDGVEWFCSEIFPKVRLLYPNAQFYIVGSNPVTSVKRLATNNAIQVTGYVDDIRPFYSTADVCVVPLRLARGVQNKVLEAMAMGNSVVATSNAVQGIMKASESNLFIANNPAEFAEKINLLLTDNSQRQSIGAQARNFVEENFNWQKNMSRLAEMLEAGRQAGLGVGKRGG